jgi:hypothetical protein
MDIVAWVPADPDGLFSDVNLPEDPVSDHHDDFSHK